MRPIISVVVPTYNDSARLEKCINALLQQSLPRNNYEIIVIDNNSSDSCIKIKKKYEGSVVFLSEHRQGSYVARNKGVFHAKGKILAFTDADCIPDKDWLATGLSLSKLHGPRAVIGGRIVQFVEGMPLSRAMLEFQKAASLNQEMNYLLGFFATANMFVYKQVFLEVGFFNDIMISCGDREWGYRAKKSGLIFYYAKTLRVKHPFRDWPNLLQRKKRVLYGLYQYVKTYNRKLEDIPYNRQQHATLSAIARAYALFMKIYTLVERIKLQVAYKVLQVLYRNDQQRIFNKLNAVYNYM